jgi:amino acid transporter
MTSGNSSMASPSAVSASLAKDRLGVFSVIMFAMTAAAPLLVVSGLVVGGWAGPGIVGLPLAFVVLGIVLAVFAAGYVAMARHITNAGAFYSYIAQGTNRALGVAASLIALLAYNMLQVGIYGFFGVIGQGLLAEKLNWNVSWWVVALVGWLLVAIMGALRVDINSKVIGVLLAIEIVFVVIYDIVAVGKPEGGSVSFSAFEPKNLFVAGVGAAFALVVTAFTGFEAAPVFAEEAKHVRKTIPAATYLALAVMGVIYAITSWATTVTIGPDKVVDAARNDSSFLFFDTVGRLFNGGTADLALLLLFTSLFAAAVSFHNSVARYSFALGREGVLPRVLGTTNARTGAPLVSSLVQTVIGLLTIAVYAIAGWDPTTKLFFWLGTTGGFGILILLIGTSIAAILYFAKDNRGESIWSRLIAPALATIALLYVFWETANSFSNLLGVKSSDAIAWILPGLYAVMFVIGILWALYLRSARPEVYNAIGLGARAVTGVIPSGDAYVVSQRTASENAAQDVAEAPTS